jgi:hypothetical protein
MNGRNVYIARRIETIIFDKKFFEKINRLPNRLVGIDQRTIKAASSFFVQFFNGLLRKVRGSSNE